MTPEETRELLARLGSGTLAPAERSALFEAALQDQALFNEVAEELEFEAFLASPATRAQLANRIDTEVPKARGFAWRPAWLTLAGALAASAVVWVAVTRPPAPKLTEENRVKVSADRGEPKGAVAEPEAVAGAKGAAKSFEVPAPAKPVMASRAPAVIADKRVQEVAEIKKDALRAAPIAAPVASVAAPAMPLGAVAPQQIAVLGPGAEAADMLSNQLVDGRRIQAVGREKIDQAEQRQSRQSEAGQVQSAQQASTEQLIAIGRNLGADTVILERVDSLPASGSAGTGGAAPAVLPPLQDRPGTNTHGVALRAQVIDARKGTPMATVTAEGTSLKEATAQLAGRIRSQLGAPGEVTAVNGDQVTFQLGDRVMTVGSRLDVIRGEAKVGEVTIRKIEGSSATGTFSGSGGARAGDRVKLAK